MLFGISTAISEGHLFSSLHNFLISFERRGVVGIATQFGPLVDNSTRLVDQNISSERED